MSKMVSTLKASAIPYPLNDDWTWYKWGDIIKSYQQGLIRSNAELNCENGIRYFKMNFINVDGSYTFDGLPKTFATNEEIENFRINSGDFFINVRNSKELVGKSCVTYNVDGEILFNHMLVRITHKSYVSGAFINAYLNTSFGKKLLDTCKKGTTTVIALYQKDLYELPIPIPQKDLLEKIESIYNQINRKIELNNKINAELEQMAKTLYNYWFVQFDFPNAKGKPYKSSGGKMVYNEVLKREVPGGWHVKKLGDVLKTYLGGTPSTANERFWAGNIPWMNSGEVANFPILATQQSITEEAIKNSSTKLMKKGSVLLSITRHLRVNILGIDACINQSIAGIEENNLFKNSYIYFSILNDIERLMSLRTGAQQPHINKEIVDSSPFIVADKEILEKYYKAANPMFDRMINNANQNQQLAALRDWLLPMLMNGQVKVAGSHAQKDYTIPIASKPRVDYKKTGSGEWQEQRFNLWLVNQGLAARGEIDTTTLRAIFDAMDDEDK